MREGNFKNRLSGGVCRESDESGEFCLEMTRTAEKI